MGRGGNVFLLPGRTLGLKEQKGRELPIWQQANGTRLKLPREMHQLNPEVGPLPTPNCSYPDCLLVLIPRLAWSLSTESTGFM